MENNNEPLSQEKAREVLLLRNLSEKSNIICDKFVNILVIIFSCSVHTFIIHLNNMNIGETTERGQWRFTMNIDSLESHEISGVMFIRDYIQFLFEGERGNGILTTYNLPMAVINGHHYNRNTSGYRDILCSLINKKVEKSEVSNDRKIKITFENCVKLVVPLEVDETDGFEAAMLRIGDSITVW
jgi:hypothetical protein